jgi:hypothetical protein
MENLQRAVLALSVGSLVEIKQIGVEEVADLGRGTVLGSSGEVVLVLSLAMSGAERCVEGSGSEDTRAHESVKGLVIQRGIDSSVVEVLNIAETSRYLEGLVHVTVGTSDGNLELVAVLSMEKLRICERTRKIMTLTHSCWHWIARLGLPRIHTSKGQCLFKRTRSATRMFTLIMVVDVGFGHASAGSRLGSLSKYRLKDMQPLMTLHLAAHFSVS